MFATELFYIFLTLIGLALLRFGVPLLVTMLIKVACCRLFHLKP